MLEKIKQFYANVKKEMKTVSWPSKVDVKEGTIVVIFISTVVALFLAVVDFILKFVMNMLF